jgi:hypothetical protein
MKTALCLSGQARFGSYAFRSLAENLLKGLDCDVFLFLWRLPGQTEQEALESAQNFVGRYVPIKACVAAEQIEFPAKDYATRIHAGSNVFNIQSMFYALMAADQLRVEHEKKHGFKYECVIRSRVDVSCFAPMNLKQYAALLPHYVFLPEVSYFSPGLNDTFAFGSSELMEKFSKVYDKLDTYFRDDHKQFNPHVMLLHHMMKNQIGLAYLSIPVEIVREVSLPEVFHG